MKYIIDFYKELDTFNTILFWGVIIVILLLLIFSIIMVIKNRKLEEIIESSGIITDEDNDLPIRKIDESVYEEEREEKYIPPEEPKQVVNTEPEQYFKTYSEVKPADDSIPIINSNVKPVAPVPKPVENHFVAEEYVMNSEKNTTPEFPSISPNTTETNNNLITKPTTETGPYQRNVLRNMSLNQTSPLGITKRENSDYIKAIELQRTLNENRTNNPNDSTRFNDFQKRTAEPDLRRSTEKERYLQEVSDKLAQKKAEDGLTRTSYELQQEQDAIISYRELMEKKDKLNIVDDEEAIISIEELTRRNREKLYNITEEAEDNKFIDELKNFRSDL